MSKCNFTKHVSQLTAAFALMIAVATTLTACNRPGPATSQDSASVALPARPVIVFAFNVTTAVTDDQSIKPMTLFAPTDTLIASVHTRGAAPKVDLSAKLIYQDGQVYGEQAQAIHPTGPVTTNFPVPRETPWPRGRYVVDIGLNGKRVVQQPIEVGDPSGKPAAK